MVDRMYVAKIALYALIIALAVLVVDVVVLLLLNLLWNVDANIALLWWEGVVMAVFDVFGWRSRSPKRLPGYLRKPPAYGVQFEMGVKYRYPWFWHSLGIAGFVLLVLSIYLVSQYYL